MKLTTKQQESLNKLKKHWENVGKPYPLLGCSDCAMVEVSDSKGRTSITFGIEPDGYYHT